MAMAFLKIVYQNIRSDLKRLNSRESRFRKARRSGHERFLGDEMRAVNLYCTDSSIAITVIVIEDHI